MRMNVRKVGVDHYLTRDRLATAVPGGIVDCHASLMIACGV